MKGFIYCLTSPSGKKYIGQCMDFKRRINNYKYLGCKKQPKIYRALLKYGFDSFKIEILEEVDKSLLNEKEKFYILQFDSMRKGYNCTSGGDAYEVSDETKEKMRLAHSGNKNHFFGKTHTLETRKILSENSKKQMESGNPFQGKRHSKESIEKMRNYRIDKKLSSETKEKLNKLRLKKDKSNFAKKYKIISPNNEVFVIKGVLKEFIEKHNLSLACVKEYLNCGKIPPPINPSHNRMTSERLNSTTWEFLRLE